MFTSRANQNPKKVLAANPKSKDNTKRTEKNMPSFWFFIDVSV